MHERASIPASRLSDLEEAARARLSQTAWDFIVGGAGDELTMRWNEEAFDRIQIHPRILRDVSSIDTRCELLGERLEHPILLAPTGFQKFFHSHGEREAVEGSNASGAPYVISTASTTPLEELVKQARVRPWFQLYVQADRSRTKELLQRIAQSGVAAVCVTVDTPVAGARRRYTPGPLALPADWSLPHLPHLDLQGSEFKAMGMAFFQQLLCRNVTWNDLEWIRGEVKVPLLLKGVLHPEDAQIALQSGIDGIIVSNHGGRNLDTVPATADAFPRVAEVVAGRVPLLLDGGIRRGTDIFKAIAMGASAILIGRPYLYGMAAEGAPGIARVVQRLRHELELAMVLAGARSLSEIGSEFIQATRG